MQYFYLLAAFIPAVLAKECWIYAGSNTISYDNCHWEGTSPFCGAPSHKLGYVASNGRVVRGGTEWESRAKQCQYKKNGVWMNDDGRPSRLENCCDTYGSGCVSGHKILWCDKVKKD